jgi:NADP-dependent 3-hydroxy acid dehydrogenase YdfG
VPGFEGKRALVTGGSAGIGHAIAAALAMAGARVVIASRTAATLDSAAARIGATPIIADLSTAAAASRLAAAANSVLGGVDILVLSSGIHIEGAMADLPDDALPWLLQNNVIGPAALARHLTPALVAARGDVLVVNSTVVRAQNVRGRAYYAAGQQAMKALSDGLRDELNESGVRVTSVFPGVTATPRQQNLHMAAGKAYQPARILQPEDVAAIALAAIALPATAEATDIYIRPRHKT